MTWTGTSFTGLSGLVDGRAGALTVLGWGSATESLRVSFERPVPPRLAALVNLRGVPAGVEVEVSLKTEGGGYDYEPQTVETFLTPSGDVCCLATWPEGLDLCDGCEFTIPDSGEEFELGEVVVSSGLSVDLDPRWSSGAVGGSRNLSRAGQLVRAAFPAPRVLDLPWAGVDADEILVLQDSLLSLQMALANDPRAAVVADLARPEATFLYGFLERSDPIRFGADQRGGSRWSFREMVGRPF